MKRLANKLIRYLGLYFYLVKFSLMNVLIYRINSLIMGITPIIWMLGAFSLLFIIFKDTREIAGWNFWQLTLLLGIHETIYSICWTVFLGNLFGFVRWVETGKFDMVLLKPVNPRFFVSFNSIDLSGTLGGVFNACFLVILALYKLNLEISVIKALIFFSCLLVSCLIFYLLFFLLSCLSLYWVKAESFLELLLQAVDFDHYPAEIYSDWFRFFLFFFLPILFFAYTPTAILLGKLPDNYFIFSLLVAVWLLIIAKIIWQNGLRRYQSASS